MFDPWFFSIAACAVIFAGVSKGGFGSGAAFASGVILALIIDPGTAVAIMLPLLMLMDVASLKPYWRKWLTRESIVLILGAIPGVAIGAWLFSWVNADVFRLIIGLIALGFVGWQMVLKLGLMPPARASLPDWAGVIAGAFAGFTSFVSHAGGPPAAVYLLSKKITKTEYQATTVLTFWAINLFKAVPYAYLGMFSRDTLTLNLILAPFAILGVYIGVKGHHWISEKWFFGLTYVLLVVAGGKLIWDAVT